MFSSIFRIRKTLDEDPDLRAALTKTLSNKERTDEVLSYPEGQLIIDMMVDAFGNSEELAAREVELIHICQLFRQRQRAGQNEFSSLVAVMKKLYREYLLTTKTCKVIFGEVAVDRKLGKLAQVLDLLQPLTSVRVTAVMAHAEAVVTVHDHYAEWKFLYDSFPNLSTQKECAFANFLEIYVVLHEAALITENNRETLLAKHHYFAAMWILDKCGVTTLRKDAAPIVTTQRLLLSEKIARLLMRRDDMCEMICKYAVTHQRDQAIVPNEEIDEMANDIIVMLFADIPELKANMQHAFRAFVFDSGSSLVNSLRDSKFCELTKKNI